MIDLTRLIYNTKYIKPAIASACGKAYYPPHKMRYIWPLTHYFINICQISGHSLSIQSIKTFTENSLHQFFKSKPAKMKYKPQISFHLQCLNFIIRWLVPPPFSLTEFQCAINLAFIFYRCLSLLMPNEWGLFFKFKVMPLYIMTMLNGSD